jgi:hypothetical protein
MKYSVYFENKNKETGIFYFDNEKDASNKATELMKLPESKYIEFTNIVRRRCKGSAFSENETQKFIKK